MKISGEENITSEKAVSGGCPGMDKVEKMDCRANSEVILRVREPLQPDFCKMSYKEMASHSVQEQLLGDLPGNDYNHRPIGIFRIERRNSVLISLVDVKNWDDCKRRAHA
jgi:hypothetical protein